MRRTLISTFALLFVLTAAQAVFTQAPAAKPLATNVQEHKLASKLMGREMPYRVVLPKAYATSKESRYPVIYLLHGFGGKFSNWTDSTDIENYIATVDAIVVTPEGENGWYVDQTGGPNRNYESYIVKELIPVIDAKYRTTATREKRAIAGLSMGGYGALKFGMKYPEMFVLAGSFSGAVGASSYTKIDELPPGMLRNALVSVFGEPGSPVHASNDLFKIVADATPEKIKSLPFIYLDCGTEDFLFENNRQFVSRLIDKKIPHEYRELPGAHNWQFWDKQVQEFMRLAARTFSQR